MGTIIFGCNVINYFRLWKKVCLVIGAGAGIGGTVAKKFATNGYHAFLARRTDEDGLNKLISDIEKSGGESFWLIT